MKWARTRLIGGDNEAEKWLLPTRRAHIGHGVCHAEASRELQLFFLLSRRLLRPAWAIAIDDIGFQNTRILVRPEAAVERFLPDIPLRSLLHARPLFNVGRGKAFAQQGKALDPLCQRVSIAVIRYALGKGPRKRRGALRLILAGAGYSCRAATTFAQISISSLNTNEFTRPL